MNSLQTKLNLIHAANDTKTPIDAEQCFKSYLRASVGIANVASMDAIQLIDARVAFSEHVNRLYTEYKKRADRAEAA
jgi:hypothetical protein